MGAVPRSPVGKHAGAICSQYPGLLSRPDLSVANSLQEQMSHPPSPWGHGCVTPPSGPDTATGTPHLGVDPCTELGQNQPESKGTLQRPEKLTAGVTAPQDGALLGIWSTGQRRRGSLVPPGTPGTAATAAPAATMCATTVPGCPAGTGNGIWISRRPPTSSPQSPCPAHPLPCKAPRKGSLALPPHARGTARHGTARHGTAQGQRCRRCLSGSRSRPDPAWFPAGPREWLAPVSFGLIKIHSA